MSYLNQKEQNEHSKDFNLRSKLIGIVSITFIAVNCACSHLRRLFLRDERLVLHTWHHIRFQSNISFIYFSLLCCRINHRPTHKDYLYHFGKITFIEKDCTFCFYTVFYQQSYNDLFCRLLYAVYLYSRCLACCDISFHGFH